MKYLKKLFFSLSEVFIMVAMQYLLLIIAILIFGKNKSIIIGTIILSIFEIIYIIFKYKKKKIIVLKDNYFPYILLGISFSIIYNMIVFLLGVKFTFDNSIPLIINIISSCFIGPIFEEVLFRYSLISKLLKFNNKTGAIIISIIIFCLCHNNINNMIFALILGSFNSILYVKRRNILIPICIHIFANLISTFLFEFNIIIFILGIILLVISILMLKLKKHSYSL